MMSSHIKVSRKSADFSKKNVDGDADGRPKHNTTPAVAATLCVLCSHARKKCKWSAVAADDFAAEQ